MQENIILRKKENEMDKINIQKKKKGVPQDMAHLSLTNILSNLKQKTYLESVNSKAVRLHLNIQYITIDLGI